MAWVMTGNLKGPQGEPGPQGVKGDTGPKGDKGEPGERGAPGVDGQQGPEGPRGPAGKDGRGISIRGNAATYSDLPTLTAGDAGVAYLLQTDGDLYVWDGQKWPEEGKGTDFRGPEGPQGAQGPRGTTGPQGPAGPTGADGPQGPTGPAGARGTKISTGTGTPGAVNDTVAGDLYIDNTSGTLYTYRP